MVNNPLSSDVKFIVEGREFLGHKVQLLNSSDFFKTMFDGHYREKDASTIPIPNVRWEVWEKMMYCCYTGGAGGEGTVAGGGCGCASRLGQGPRCENAGQHS